MTPDIATDLEQVLRTAGWQPGRRVAVGGWCAALAGEGYAVHPAATAVLAEFGGLRVGRQGPGTDMARHEVRVDPTLAVGERERFEEWLPELRGRGVVPVAEVGHGFLGVAADGEAVLVAEEVRGRWPSFAAALRSLALGTRQPAA